MPSKGLSRKSGGTRASARVCQINRQQFPMLIATKAMALKAGSCSRELAPVHRARHAGELTMARCVGGLAKLLFLSCRTPRTTTVHLREGLPSQLCDAVRCRMHQRLHAGKPVRIQEQRGLGRHCVRRRVSASCLQRASHVRLVGGARGERTEQCAGNAAGA